MLVRVCRSLSRVPWLVTSALVVALAGCAQPAGAITAVSATPVVTPTSPAAASPTVDFLLAAAKKVSTTTFRELVSSTMVTPHDVTIIDTTTDVDPGRQRLLQRSDSRVSESTSADRQWIIDELRRRGVPESVETRYVGDVYYGPAGGRSWTRIEMAKLRPASPMRARYEGGLAFQVQYVIGLATAVQNPAGDYSGEIDLEAAAADPRNRFRGPYFQLLIGATGGPAANHHDGRPVGPADRGALRDHDDDRRRRGGAIRGVGELLALWAARERRGSARGRGDAAAGQAI